MALTFRRRAFIVALKNAWPFWMVLSGIAIAAVFGFALSKNASASVRYAGAILQVFGLGTVAFGLSQIRRYFCRPSLLERVFAWLRQLGATFRRPTPITLEAHAGGFATVSGEAALIHKAGRDSSLDRRVTILEENLNRLRVELDAKDQKIRNDLSTLTGTIEEERRARETEVRRISSQLEELAVGGLHLELVGITWLTLGVVGASIPDEIVVLWNTLLAAV
jgi:hypothetical protein